ncbi:MAG: patatin-like phospholipase family protein [Burkholderiaceae bacterium]|nr:patatin-like phospholipase family protein [Burkholderiaceae bacterium]
MKIGIALGSGSARGFSHIGVLEVLLENGIIPTVVAGCSIGAIVGASYASGKLTYLKREALSIHRFKWTQFFNPSLSFDRWINIKQMQLFLVRSGISRKKNIETLPISFGSVCCDLDTGKEIWSTKGNLFDSVWTSMAMPGVFPPVSRLSGGWVIDGGIVNPVPVSLCRSMGADIVIAVNLNADLLKQPTYKKSLKQKDTSTSLTRVFDKAKQLLTNHHHVETPDFFSTVGRAINIAQDQITKSRLAGDPPEILLNPRVAHIGLFETYRAREAIEEGRKCANRILPNILDLIKDNS